MKLKDCLRKKAQAKRQSKMVSSDKAVIDSITVEPEKAESEIVRTVQREVVGRLRPGKCVSKPCPNHKLDVSVDEQ